MLYRKLILGVVCSILMVGSSMAADPVVTFNFNDQTNPTWANEFATVVSNYTLSGAGRIDALSRTNQVPAPPAAELHHGDFCFLYGVTPGPGSITLNDGIEDRWFVVSEVHAGTAATNAPYPTLKGMLEGVEQWEIQFTQGQLVSNTHTTCTYPVYTNQTSGDLSLPIDEMVWESPVASTWQERIAQFEIQAVPAIPTQTLIFDWDLDSYWTPHTVWHDEYDFLGGTQPYWWSGFQTTNSPMVIHHRPGLEDRLIGETHYGVYPSLTNDTAVGGSPWSGIYFEEPFDLNVGDVVEVDYETQIFLSDNQFNRILDVYLSSTTSTTNDSNFFGSLGTNADADEVGFGFNTTTATNLIIYADQNDPYFGLIDTPLIDIPLSDLGISSATNGAGTDPLVVSIRMEKTSTINTFETYVSISNTVNNMFWEIDTTRISSGIYNNTSRLLFSTADNLSINAANPDPGDTTSGNGGLGGYSIDQLKATVQLELEPLFGYEAFVDSHGLVYGVTPDTLEYDDYDSDMLLNIYEYAYGGDMANGTIAPATLPTLTVSGGVASYAWVQVVDTNSGITYVVEKADDLTGGFGVPVWDQATQINPTASPHYVEIVEGRTVQTEEFFRTTVVTNSP